ncbi:unnamed protein product [Linum trigynum]|uniref:Uncharacterized protein n=1 Tax=Linum trigynum TaxID=586398 RepID=A0AAV2DL41_9ROSI
MEGTAPGDTTTSRNGHNYSSTDGYGARRTNAAKSRDYHSERVAARSEAWRAHDWMQRRWKTSKQREAQDQVGSEGRMRSRHEKAPEEEWKMAVTGTGLDF